MSVKDIGQPKYGKGWMDFGIVNIQQIHDYVNIQQIHDYVNIQQIHDYVKSIAQLSYFSDFETTENFRFSNHKSAK